MQHRKQIHMFEARKMTRWLLTMIITMTNKKKRKIKLRILEKLARPRIKPVVPDPKVDI